MLTTQIVFVASVLFVAELSQAEKQPLDAANLVGKWRSVKLEGKDIGSLIVGMDAEFSKDGGVTLIAKVKQGSELKLITKKGTYKVIMKQLEMTFDMETRRSKAWFHKDRLIIQDPALDSRVHFERVKSKK